MYLGIDIHKRYAQVAVMDEAGEIVEEVRVLSDSGKFWAQARREFAFLSLQTVNRHRPMCKTSLRH